MTENGNGNTPEILFEVSWEVCNKVGGIYTVLTTKCHEALSRFGEHYLFIGPDIWREDHDNPDFIEDNTLFLGWKEHASLTGLSFRTGRWNIPGKPQVIIIDFTPLIPRKDEIFSKAWEDYRLDSLTGGWDYIEAALFGYAAGMIIKSFSEYYRFKQVIANFHEWMTGMGILYLEKEAPYIGTVFTTHATTVGRSIAGNGLPLYENLTEYAGDEMAGRLGVTAKHSLEKLAAINCDQFTTVSEITALECSQLLGRRPDVITPNGFNPDLVPPTPELRRQRETTRKMLGKIASAVFGYEFGGDFLAIGTSGRYEFRNKGIDVFIRTLDALNRDQSLDKEILALIMVPANNYGPRRSISQRLKGEQAESSGSMVLTHNLHDADSDPVIRLLNELGLKNDKDHKVKVIFIPCYLDGQDGIVNLTYYQILAGLDYTVFPSYYEPWGYTPLESIAFGVPTLTTDQAGFGLWMSALETDNPDAPVAIAPRRNQSDEELIGWITTEILKYTRRPETARKELAESSRKYSKKALWKNLIDSYLMAYSYALSEVVFEDRPEPEFAEDSLTPVTTEIVKANEPNWIRVQVESAFPESLHGLEEMSRNLWWTWNCDAGDLFRTIDPEIWEQVEQNPITLLRQIPLDRLMELEEDEDFNTAYNRVYNRFRKYLDTPNENPGPKIAYFSMEFGFHASLKIYSGGLGILAGDYLKEASDRNVPLIGIGILYRFGYFRQVLSVTGDQVSEDVMEEFTNLPVEPALDQQGQWIQVPIGLPGRLLHVRVWKTFVGRVCLYLLDTDFDANQPADRSITYHLYGGDEENRLKQEMVLGLGGIRILDRLGISPDIFHCNEGHAAFIGFERIRRLMEIKRFTFDESLEVVRSSTLFTTHTPVPAGHDTFTENMIRTYMGHYPERFAITWEDFIGLGKVNRSDPAERFSMSNLAARLSQEINAVSNLHGEVTRNMFQNLWKGYYPDELHIGFVTNGVHYQTWAAASWQKLYLDAFGEKFLDNQSNTNYWSRIHSVSDERIWAIRQKLRKDLIDYIRSRLEKVSIKRHEPPKQIKEILQTLNEKTLTIGFARRFATYKRATLLFHDLERLSGILNNPERPVQFIFAGKAHPRDKAGQDLIKYIVEVSRRPDFRGRIIFLENYDMTVARKLVQGVDIWLNTPTRPLEASGTSGMKATMNGVMNFSVLDGWWCEGYRPNAGWSLPQERVYDDQTFQDELDATTIYDKLEDEIVPLFYKVNHKGVPEDWILHIKNTVAQIAPLFTTRRMIDDYYDRFYKILGNRSSDMRANNYHLAREITRWKKKIARYWEKVEVSEVHFSKDLSKPLRMGEEYTAEVVLKMNGLSSDDIGVELVVVSVKGNEAQEFVFRQEFNEVERLNGHCRYRIGTIPSQPGIFNYGIRIFPKSDLLPHRQDFGLIRWI
jgi:phosphorylase/glycogen(starch) synthase